MVKVLFICLGNICRSPSAEGIMYHYLRKRGHEKQIYCDSAGTSGYHFGDRADARMRSHAEQRGFKLLSLSRQVERDDFEEFDYIMAMDESNYDELIHLCPNEEYKSKIKHFIDYATSYDLPGVPDPYYGGDDGFEHVLDIIEEGCLKLLDEIETKLNG